MAKLDTYTDKYEVTVNKNNTEGRFQGQKRRPWLGEESVKNSANSFTDSEPPNIPTLETIIAVDPTLIVNWELHDRPTSELGDIEGLANEFKTIGQQQPCIVRPHPKSIGKFELIVGERRWRASTIAGINLKVIVKELTDSEAALAQAAENDNRVDLSDYAKGMSYAKLIDSGIIKQKDIIDKLGKSKQYVSALLSFSKIPSTVIDAIGDMSQITHRTAEGIKQISSKGPQYIDALVKLAPKLREGKMGVNSLNANIIKLLADKKRSSIENKKILSKDGRHIFTWRNDNNNNPSIHFPNNIVTLLNNNDIDIDKITNDIALIVEGALENVKKTN